MCEELRRDNDGLRTKLTHYETENASQKNSIVALEAQVEAADKIAKNDKVGDSNPAFDLLLTCALIKTARNAPFFSRITFTFYVKDISHIYPHSIVVGRVLFLSLNKSVHFAPGSLNLRIEVVVPTRAICDSAPDMELIKSLLVKISGKELCRDC